jgi:hypothetical protein
MENQKKESEKKNHHPVESTYAIKVTVLFMSIPKLDHERILQSIQMNTE